MRWLIYTVCYSLLLFMVLPVYAQTPLLYHYTKKDGLNSNTVYEIVKDNQGFLWFCTDRGICRFDGHQYINFTSKDGLPDNEIFGMQQDSAGRCWLACYNNKPCYIQYNKVYSSANNIICKLVEKGNNKNAFAVSEQNPEMNLPDMYLPPADRRVEVWLYSFLNQQKIKVPFIYKDKLYFLSNDKLMRVDNKNVKQVFNNTISDVVHVGNSIYALERKTRYALIYQIKLTGDTSRIVQLQVFPYPIKSLIRYGDSLIIMNTDNGTQLFPTASKDTGIINIIGSMHLSSIVKDNENNYWFSTYNDGAYMLPHSNPIIYKKGAGLNDDANIKSICVMPDGRIIAGNDDGTINIIQRGKVRTKPLDTASNQYNRVLKIVAINDSEIMAGSDKGLYIANVNNDQLPKLYLILAIKAVSKYGNEYLVGNSAGAEHMNITNKKFDTLWNKRTTAIVKDSRGIVWLGTLDGVYYSVGKEIKRFVQSPLLMQSRITDMVAVGKRAIIIATNQYGLFIWNYKHLKHISDEDGLSSNLCRHVFADSEQNIWVCTDKGLDEIYQTSTGADYSINHFTRADGLPVSGINDMFIKDGKIYIASQEGIIVLNKNKPSFSPPLNTYITSVEVRDSNYSGISDFALAYNQNDLQISYTAVSFSEGSNLSYKYILDGSGVDTVYTTLNSVNLSSVKPGSYHFMVWAKNKYGAWSDKPASVSFTIKPPFWEKGWFIALCAIAIGALIYLVYRRRIAVVKQAEEEKTILNKKMMELEMQALRAQINPHFIFNALNSIQNYYSQNDEQSANRYMSTFSKLIRQTLVHARQHWLPLAEEIDMIKSYLLLEHMRFKNKFSYEIRIADEINPDNIQIPAMLIQPYIENAINHGLRHPSNYVGFLDISFFIEDSNLVCRVDDNGIGINSKKAETKKTKHASLGMNITKDRIETINELYNIKIQVLISDSKQAEKKMPGTCVDIIIPIIKKQYYEQSNSADSR